MSRTLVLSLLRAGDALVHLPALAALRAADPGGELHLLVQAAAGPVAELLATQATVHRLPRDHLGGPLGPAAPLVSALRRERFDLVANLTQRRFAGELAAALGGRRTLGFALVDGRPAVSSPWLAALNDWGTHPALSVLHYGEVACQALGLAAADPGLRERLPPAAAAWWRAVRGGLGRSDGPLVALQLTTSEPKKTYPAERWRALSAALAGRLPGARQVALAAPSELPLVASALQGAPAAPLACSLSQAAALLTEAALLVTGDTALVHLAALLRVPVLLLSSGSSAFRELGPAGAGHAVLQALWPCAPCRHDRSCLASDDGYPCTAGVAPELAGAAAAALATGAALPEPRPGGSAALFRSGVDAQGLTDWRPVGWAPPDTGCAEGLREHLLAELPVVPAPAPGGPLPGRRPGPAELPPLQELRAAAGAVRAQAEGGDPGALARAAATASSPFVLAFLAAAGARLREAPGGSPELAGELARLEQRLAAIASRGAPDASR